MEHTQNKLIAKAILNETTIKVVYSEELIFRTLKRGNFNLTNMEIVFSVVNRTLTKKVIMQTEN